jgi:hypothetical protein
MGDIGDYWREHKEYKSRKKAEQRRLIPSLINRVRKAGLYLEPLDAYEEHWRVAEAFDWWPSTGYWKMLRNNEVSGRGVVSLIKTAKSHGGNHEQSLA